jgi:NADH:ubiquinone reductase (H+-translocating)
MSVGPVRLSGFFGWLGWLGLHIAFLTGYRNRVGAVLSWLVAFTSESRRERAFTTRQLEGPRDIYDPVSQNERPPEDHR